MSYQKPSMTELNTKQKKNLLTGVILYVLGFIFLISIGSAINKNGYIIRAFLAPFLTLCGIIYIPYRLYRGK
jgi:uncharacterized membrane protein YdcZ (DUF606 family)